MQVLTSSKSCRRGHLNPRRLSDGHCADCRFEDRGKAHEATKRWREKNLGRFNEVNRAWRKKNQARMTQLHREWMEAHPEYRETMKEYVRENSAYYAEKTRHRKAALLRATVSWADPLRIREMYERAARVSECLGVQMHVDHVVPLKSKIVSGLHCEANLRIIAATANQRKSNRVWPDM